MDSSKQDQLRSTIFNSITNYISLIAFKAIYSVVPAFVCHHLKIYKKLNGETFDLFISLIPGAFYLENSAAK